ncbi:MAG: hypothetical protein NTZ59_10595 [Bacteroidetes bacterium]|nr:hypothetical protein [Bacteroidota bacterium]
MFAEIKNKYPEVLFITKFLLLFLFLYFGTEFCIGITSPGNHYSKFCDDYLNYINWLRVSILSTSEGLSNLLGYKAVKLNNITIEGFNGFRVNMVYSCIGYGILSFWTAFVITYPSTIKQKMVWLFSGLLSLWFVNVLRVLLLLILINKTKNVETFPQHHLAYNIATYIIVFVMIYFFTRNKKQDVTN